MDNNVYLTDDEKSNLSNLLEQYKEKVEKEHAVRRNDVSCDPDEIDAMLDSIEETMRSIDVLIEKLLISRLTFDDGGK